MKSPYTGLKRILMAFKYSYDGFVAAFKSEEAFRQDILVCTVLTITAALMPIPLWLKAILWSSLILILLMELVNTAIETIIDRISPQYHELSKKAKDIGSLLVLIAFINAIVVWLSSLYTWWPVIWNKLLGLF